ncbi:hypothetical protein IWW52_001235, partial [Coemansia sp. RSA 2704]
LDTARLTEFLASAMDIAQPITLAQFNVGQSNPTYLVTDARGRRFVLRKKPAGALLSKTAHAVEREFRVLRALGEHTRVPVPRVYALCEDARVVGTPFYLMEYLEGRVLSDIRLPGVAAAERPRYWRALVDVLSELHKVDIERAGLASFGKPRGFYERQLRSLTRVAEAQAAATDSDGRAVGALRRLGELQKWFARQWCPDETAVVHGDFKMDNVVWDAREPRIIGVLDWELSTLGNPRTDLANLLQPLLVPYHVNFERGGVLQGLRDAPAEENVPAEGELLRRYCGNMGREYPMAGWEYAKVFGLFRNAVIQQGVAARVARGQASSAFAHLVGEVFPRTMDMAMAIVDQIEARTLAPCVEHNSPAFDADGLRWVFKLFKGRARSPNELALYLAVHESTGERLQRQRKKVDVSFTLENLRTRGLDYSKHQGPITVWVDSVYSTWGDDRFVALSDMEAFTADDTACLVVRFHVRETVVVGAPTAQPSPAIAVFVPERIAAPFNRLLRSARFSDIQFELRDSAALLLSPGPRTPGDARRASYAKSGDALGISYAKPGASYPTPPEPHSRSPCITPMPGDTGARALPYAHQPRLGAASPPPAPPGPRYHAHKAILMAVSPVFEAMFGNGMRETFERVVEVWDVTPRAFERLLEYAYTHTCELPADLSADELVETLLCADQFAVAGLLNTCWRSLIARLAPDTLWDIWSIAHDLGAREQQRACLAFCTRNFTELCACAATMWAPAHLLREALASDALNVQSEELLFETVVRWAAFREDDHDEVLASPAAAADEAVLTCRRSPSNLALLPRSPWARRAARRKPELTREAFTTPATAPPSPRSPPPLVTRLSADRTPGSAQTARSSVWSSMFARKDFLPELLPCIRFPMMDRGFLLHVVERNAELMAMPLMKDLLLEAYRFHAFNPPPDKHERRRASECQARPPQHEDERARESDRSVHYAKIILPLNTTDELTICRSQRRKQVHKVSARQVNFSP